MSGMQTVIAGIDDPLPMKVRGYPRVFMNTSQMLAVQSLLKSKDPVALTLHQRLLENAEKGYQTALLLPIKTATGRSVIQGHMRRLFDEFQNFGYATAVTGNQKYSQRARERILQVCQYLENWKPEIMIDIGEAALALAMGVDANYRVLTDADLVYIRSVVYGKLYKEWDIVDKDSKRWGLLNGSATANMENNWSIVTSGGIAASVPVLLEAPQDGKRFFDEMPQNKAALSIFRRSYKSLRDGKAIANYGPHGGWHEGMGYWDFSGKYLFGMSATAQRVFGDDFGLMKLKGIPQTGLYPLYMTGSSRWVFNYGDAHAASFNSWVPHYLANFYGQPHMTQLIVQGIAEKSLTTASVPQLAEYAQLKVRTQPQLKPLPFDRYFAGKGEVASFRSSWEYGKGLSLMIKAGELYSQYGITHAQLDSGSFVLDYSGVRIATDIGAENYGVSGVGLSSPNSVRWKLYRVRAEGNNTLVLNPSLAPDQSLNGRTRLYGFQSTAQRARIFADLTPAYLPFLGENSRVTRGVMLDRVGLFTVIRDEIRSKKRIQKGLWNAHFSKTRTPLYVISHDHRWAVIGNPSRGAVMVFHLQDNNKTTGFRFEAATYQVESRVPAFKNEESRAEFLKLVYGFEQTSQLDAQVVAYGISAHQARVFQGVDVKTLIPCIKQLHLPESSVPNVPLNQW